MIETEARIKELGRWFEQSGHTLYMVGGYVRNKLLSYPVSDIDVCSPVIARDLRPLQNDVFHVTERAYGLGTVVICQTYAGKKYYYEYTTFRKDSYGRNGEHRPEHVVFTDDIAEDAVRRDFTINALYADTNGQVVDPLGRGRKHLKQRLIAACAPNTMQQDALRILRLVRFCAQLNFAADPATFNQAEKYIDNLQSISAERIRDEFEQILLADTAYGNQQGVLDALHMFSHLGAWRYMIPELLEGEGVVQQKKYHAYDVMEHSLQSCAAAHPDLRVRLAALLHDIAKPFVYEEDGNMYRHPEEGARMATKILRRLRFERVLIREVAQLIEHHMFDLDNRAKRRAVARMIVRLGKEQFLRLCYLREADFIGSGRGRVAQSAQKWREMLHQLECEKAPFDKEALAVDGNDLMKELSIPEGKMVGELLDKLHELVLKKPAQNNYKSLIRYATMMYTESPRQGIKGSKKSADSYRGKRSGS